MVVGIGVSADEVVLLERKGTKQKVLFTEAHKGNADSITEALGSIAFQFKQRFDTEAQIALVLDPELLETLTDKDIDIDSIWRGAETGWVLRFFRYASQGENTLSAKDLAVFAVDSLADCIKRELDVAIESWFNVPSKSTDESKKASKREEDEWVETTTEKHLLSAALFSKPKGGKKFLSPNSRSVSFRNKSRVLNFEHNIVIVYDSSKHELTKVHVDVVMRGLSSGEAFLGHLLRVASSINSLDAVSRILEAFQDTGANWDKILNSPLFPRLDSSLFSLAGYAGNFEISKLLFQRGGNPCKKVVKQRNIFQFAILDGQYEICELYATHPQFEINAKSGKSQGTVLHEVVWYAMPEAVKFLLTLGIDTSEKNSYGETALDAAKVKLEQAEGETEKEKMSQIVELLESRS